MSMSMDGLRTFVAAAEHESFTRAGEIVHRTQSAVSMQIKRLEQELGQPLFERVAGRVELTRTGETFLGYARRMLRLHEKALAEVADPELSGEVRFGAPEIYGSQFLPGVLAQFAKACPNVLVDVRCDPSPQLSALVDQNELDLAVVSLSAPEPDCVVFHRAPVHWATANHGTAADQNPVPLAVFDRGCFVRASAHAALQKLGRKCRIAYVSPSIGGIVSAVRAGLAVAPLPAGAVDPDMRILGASEGFPPLPPVLVALKRSAQPLSKAAEKLAEIVVRGFQARQKEDKAA